MFFNKCTSVGTGGRVIGTFKVQGPGNVLPLPRGVLFLETELEGLRLAGHLVLPRGQNPSNHFQVLSESA